MNTTSITPKQTESILDVIRADIRKVGYSSDEGQCLFEKGDLIKGSLRETSRQIIVEHLYANEEVESNLTYPEEYSRKSIREQVEALLEPFPNLNATWTLTKAQAWYDSLKDLPEWVEGPLVYVWWEAFGSYEAALTEVLAAIAKTGRPFTNYRQGQLGPRYLQQVQRTAGMEAKLKKNQPGDLIIVPSQAGLKWRGKSVRRARVLYKWNEKNEFGSGSVAEGCRIISHPERFVRWEQLHVDCAGDEFSPIAGGEFSRAPIFSFGDGQLEFGTSRVNGVGGHCGSASGFLPQ